MKVFISWSGNLSQKLAGAFQAWLPGALQTVHPYFTPNDIEKGTRWNTEISKELEAADIGVLFVTRDNIASAWLIFEAGALSKHLEKSRVCPIIFGITHNDLPSPLRQLQATEHNKDDFKKLLKTVNSAAGENKLPDVVLDQVFEMWWPKLDEQFKSILEADANPEEESPVRSDREILEEVLDLCRLSAKQTSIQSCLSPRALVDLAKSLRAAVVAIQGKTDQNAALHALSNISDALVYMMVKHLQILAQLLSN